MAYTAVSLSELMFLEYDPAHCLPDNIAALFPDGLRTALRPGVTLAEISALRQRLKGAEGTYYLDTEALAGGLDLAEELVRGGASSGMVINGIQSRGGADGSTSRAAAASSPWGWPPAPSRSSPSTPPASRRARR